MAGVRGAGRGARVRTHSLPSSSVRGRKPGGAHRSSLAGRQSRHVRRGHARPARPAGKSRGLDLQRPIPGRAAHERGSWRVRLGLRACLLSAHGPAVASVVCGSGARSDDGVRRTAGLDDHENQRLWNLRAQMGGRYVLGVDAGRRQQRGPRAGVGSAALHAERRRSARKQHDDGRSSHGVWPGRAGGDSGASPARPRVPRERTSRSANWKPATCGSSRPARGWRPGSAGPRG